MSKTSVAHVIQEQNRTGDVLINENVDFSGLLLSANVLDGLQKAGFQRPSPIQLKAIPLGRCGLDLIVQAKSGTGKTCVFSVIALEGLQTESYALQVLVLAPTREIAIQIWDVICYIGQCTPTLKCHTFIGGMPVTEDKQKLKKCHIALGTPGRIKQLIEMGIMKTDSIRMFVLDEADKLLEESFQEQINWIYSALPENKQMLALSATYPEYLAQHLTSYMRNPTFLRLNISDPALLGIKQFRKVVAYHALPNKVFDNKTKVVIELLSSVNFQQCLIFSNLQTRAQNMADALISHGWPTAYIAGSHDQKDRNEAMSQLKTYKCRVLISTDLTSRGIDADKVNMVINLDVPKDHETYLHRIGRAGRFGTFGAAVTIVSHGQEEKELNKVEKKCNTHIKDLPDPIPSTLTKSEGTFNLDDMVSTEQIITDHTRISPKKVDVTENQNSLKENSKQQSISKRHSQKNAGRKYFQILESEFEQKGWRDKKKMPVSSDVKSEKGTENSALPNELRNELGFLSPNERGDIKESVFESRCGPFQGNVLHEEDSSNVVQQSSVNERKMKEGLEAFTKPAEICEESEKPKRTTPNKKDKDKVTRIHIPQLEHFLCHNDKGISKTYEEKEREYKKYLQEKETSSERGEIIVKPTPFVWKEGEKEHLLSMIDKILNLDDHKEYSEEDEQENRKDSTTSATQTEEFDFLPNMDWGYAFHGQKQMREGDGKSKSKQRDVSKNIEKNSLPKMWSKFINTEKKDFEQIQYQYYTDEGEYEQEHGHDFRDGELQLDEEENFEDEENYDYYDQCEEDYISDEQSEDDEEAYEEPNCPPPGSDWNNSWSPNMYPPPYFYNYPYFCMPYASHPQVTHEQKAYLFNCHLSLAQQQQHHYVSAMLEHFHQSNA
ncbi:probable ATP-dependent RNA helicase DDX20 [Saccostrea echinata]|uniref:probable ATP-dependent RNA helicase DDX20 n=1 Tax=Saccostrea echinata TaxID=191078 RepID=UPI002A830B39|nr:probable ATP-dependent RNA helicase DDX20 [Saccostrea echinata]